MRSTAPESATNPKTSRQSLRCRGWSDVAENKNQIAAANTAENKSLVGQPSAMSCRTIRVIQSRRT